jgi:hypothetical protein
LLVHSTLITTTPEKPISTDVYLALRGSNATRKARFFLLKYVTQVTTALEVVSRSNFAPPVNTQTIPLNLKAFAFPVHPDFIVQTRKYSVSTLLQKCTSVNRVSCVR